MKSHQHSFFIGHHKVLGSALLLVASSTLFACSQPEATAANSAQTESTANAETTETIAETRAINTAQTTSDPAKAVSQSLKDVSATVYKDANCGCCKEWIGHAQDHGMTATAQDITDLASVKHSYGVPDNLRSCHTAVTTDGYVFEGHVPAKYVAQFLANPPAGAIGLAVPGMPVGSPGMEYQDKFAPYQVMQINKDGSSAVYADIESLEQQL